MALLSPAYSLILPFLFLFTIPIALFATLTTIAAFSVLLFRVALVYIELALAVIPYYVLGSRAAVPRNSTISKYNPTPAPSARRRKRRGSSSSALSAGSITPIAQTDGALGISPSIGLARDYEGVGGWRLGEGSEDEDALWTNINSRLELPAEQHVRRHRRSLTSGSVPAGVGEGGKGFGVVGSSGSPEAVMNTSRSRTPPTGMFGVGVGVCLGEAGGYFPPIVGSGAGRSLKRTSSSSGSSKGSSMLTMKQK